MTPTETDTARATLFVRAIALLFLVALLSVMSQLELLLSSDGLLPAADQMALDDPTRPPTLFSLGASDLMLWLVVSLGALGALSACLGKLQRLGLAVAWLAFHAVSVAGAGLFDLVADALLIQLGLVAMALLWAPNSPWPRRLGVLLMCKVMFESGLHKMLDVAHDPSWLNGAAMGSFFEVAAIPGPLAPLANALPQPVLLLAGWALLFIELLGPFLLLSTPRVRRIIVVSWLGLMVGIIATSNFGVLPYAMLAAGLLVIEDGWVQGLWTRIASPLRLTLAAPSRDPDSTRAVELIQGAIIGLILCSSVQIGLDLLSQPGPNSPTVWLHSWRVATPYSMFRRIPAERMEMQLEVEVDGVWREAHLRHKVGPTDEHPAVVAPHHPRLPFLFWFQATLGRGLPALGAQDGGLTGRGDEQVVRGSSGATRRVSRALARALCEPGDPRRAAFTSPPSGSVNAVRAVLWSYRFGSDAEVWSREKVQDSDPVTCKALTHPKRGDEP
jgi:hypothetical protein